MGLSFQPLVFPFPLTPTVSADVWVREPGRLSNCVVVGGVLVPNQGCFKPGSCRLDVAQASDLGPVSLPLPRLKKKKAHNTCWKRLVGGLREIKGARLLL